MKRLTVNKVKQAFVYIRDNLLEDLLAPVVSNSSPICAHGALHEALQAIGAVQLYNVDYLRMPQRKTIVAMLKKMTGASWKDCRKICKVVVDQNDGYGMEADPLKALEKLYFFLTGGLLGEEFWYSDGKYEFNSGDAICVAYKIAQTVNQVELAIAA